MRCAALVAAFVGTGLMAMAMAVGAANKAAKPEPVRPAYIPLDDPQVVALMKKIDAAGAYSTPAMNLKKDENYAGTSEDREPFSGAKPYKENFLLQIEYAGAGRDKPEPEHLDTVKVGFIGPIQATVSIATGCKCH